ncbi:S26 family signal peptidase [Candidatus Protochlamydia phocaeensis]|uniref:S26 family signal peptidase n=1 Tax=Candidatus Protochlamydia phocaeensis TaxID=1414722 RepID=UPI0008392DA0|nr:S26 family signal peptidase [Candidatus Protochlamydia phocaeensis]
MENSKPLFKLVLIFYILLAVFMVCDWAWLGLRFNQSDSLPFYFFISAKIKNAEDLKIEKGMYVSFRHSLSIVKVAKQIAGMPGEEITYKDGHIYIGDKDWSVLDKTRSGIPLSPQTVERIPPDYFFVVATHPKSFDSRYDEFGLIKKDQIIEVLWPLF